MLFDVLLGLEHQHGRIRQQRWDSRSLDIDILVYDILGNYINTLISGFYSQGKYTVNWTGNDASGNSVASGIYIYQLIHDKVIITKKMTLLR